MPSAFYQFQTVHDLRDLAARAEPAVRGRLASLVPHRGGTAALDQAIKAGCQLDPAHAPDLYDALLFGATLPGGDRDVFVLATALLLADRLQQGGGTDDLWHHWDTLRADYNALPPVPRSAILRGYRVAGARGLIALGAPPRGPTLRSAPLNDVMQGLRRLARKLNEHNILPVTHAERDRHAAPRGDPLRSILVDDASVGDVPTAEAYLPSDIVEHFSSASFAPAFEACTAMILLKDLQQDTDGHPSEVRWATPDLNRAYRTLPRWARLPILAGFRALAERDGWDPYDGAAPDAGTSGAVPIPLPGG